MSQDKEKNLNKVRELNNIMKISFPDGSVHEVEEGKNPLEIIREKIGEGLARAALVAIVDGQEWDLFRPINKDCKLEIKTWKDSEGQETFRHSSTHLMAQAVVELFPEARPTIGPVVEEGFYYDFFHAPFTEEDLEKIEQRMKEIVNRKLEVSRIELSKDEAIEKFKDNKFKVEMIKEMPDGEVVTAYKQGDFIDLCRGPHLPNTGMIKAVKITKNSGAYWRGDENNVQLQRIYGISFPDKKELKEYVERLEEAKKRDHRKIGRDMDLFVFSELVGSGMPLYTPKGAIIRNEIVNYSRELNKKIGYKEVHTPNFNRAELFKISGHYDKFREDMVIVKSNYSKDEFFMKPMNCPQHTQIFASQKRSYRDLPIKFSDFANLHRDEKPGELSGLSRLRCFSQDDAHCFCRPDQVKDEFNKVLSVIKEALQTYGLSYSIRLSLWDPNEKDKYLGDEASWEKYQGELRDLLVENGIEFKAEEGEAAFYGPKMDIMAKDSMNREWQISTIQLDFNMPVRFGLKYSDKDGSEKTPLMIHRAIVGSPERFMSIIIEHYAGKFPLWLSPVQVKILPIADRHNDYCEDLKLEMEAKGLRVEVDDRQERLSKKVRDAEVSRVNYILVIGDKEMENKTLNLRTRDNEVLGEKSVDDFILDCVDEVKNRK